jgi:hypothetical protein
MIEGQLIENVNKRSEAANRKYRAFVHFLKYQKNHQQDKKTTPKSNKGVNGEFTKGGNDVSGEKGDGMN